MCDTFIYHPQDLSSKVFFGKNSDREPNEAQATVHFPRVKRNSQKQQATFIEIKLPEQCYEVVLSKPFHMWGAEMGINEYNVAIGNEALFTKTKIKQSNTGLTGMDLLRIALEISTTAEEALHSIIYYLEKHGQDACGGYQDQKFFYHNSFLITDGKETFVLETSGRHWVYKKIKGFYALSNELTIEKDYDKISDHAISFARSQGWAKKGSDFNFKKSYSSKLMTKLASSDTRRCKSIDKAQEIDKWNVLSAFEILRNHGQDPFTPQKSGTGSVCMHASGITCPHQTTASLVVEYNGNLDSQLWLTASSSPCLSLFKPFHKTSWELIDDLLKIPSSTMDDSYWWKWEQFHRKAIFKYRDMIEEFNNEQSELESKWLEQSKKINIDQQKLTTDCINESIDFLERWKKKIEQYDTRSSFLFHRFWKKQNKKVNLIHE